MYLGWTRNVAILERCGSNEERTWYIRAVLHFGWKKAKLLAAIESQAWLHSSLDEQMVSCYTEEKEVTQESESDEKDTLCVSRQHPLMFPLHLKLAFFGENGMFEVHQPGCKSLQHQRG